MKLPITSQAGLNNNHTSLHHGTKHINSASSASCFVHYPRDRNQRNSSGGDLVLSAQTLSSRTNTHAHTRTHTHKNTDTNTKKDKERRRGSKREKKERKGKHTNIKLPIMSQAGRNNHHTSLHHGTKHINSVSSTSCFVH